VAAAAGERRGRHAVGRQEQGAATALRRIRRRPRGLHACLLSYKDLKNLHTLKLRIFLLL
jgi:hypothetical protein